MDPRDGETWDIELRQGAPGPGGDPQCAIRFQGERGTYTAKCGDVTDVGSLSADQVSALLDMARSTSSAGLNDDKAAGSPQRENR